MDQNTLSSINKAGWSQAAYQAWVNRHGTPGVYAEELMKKPKKVVSHYLNYMVNVEGSRIINLLGSKGNKAVAFALLGADVTVVDISEDNAKYATELAQAANVDIQYIVSDVLDIPQEHKLGYFDYVILELGVLHYFVDLKPLFRLIQSLLTPGGTFILRDYHPFVSKMLNFEGGTCVATGNYFSEELVEVDVAFSKLLSENQRTTLKQNKIRRWTLGEIVTALVDTGLVIKSLDEEQGIKWAFPPGSPEKIEDRLPGVFTLVATKREEGASYESSI
ncbi:class I SAM-dependent methyltransferase [Pseudalkalibacillus sp. Hm43]|uniref:class I SAM-dependent methyltransferase n=1 Tax=Pseudalkalibacillus sp. Hm43 TaxID=3450742 RepID=UPI003F440BE3